MTDFCIAYRAAQFTRGNDLPCRCDAVMELRGQIFYVELDTGEMSLSRVRERWEKAYADCPHIVMVVCLSKRRLTNVTGVSGSLAGRVMFTTLRAAMRRPYACIWRDINREPVGVEKP